MKRSYDAPVDDLADYSALCAQRDALDERCRACIRPLHETVFAFEPIFEVMVQWLARWHRVAVVGRLASVCRGWESTVRRITHVNLGHNIWGHWMYSQLFERYACITSVRSHPKILLGALRPEHVARITELELDQPV
jgi:hypothetical protein